jgi:hypothetical protein
MQPTKFVYMFFYRSQKNHNFLYRINLSEKDEMGRTCGAYGGGKRGAQGVGGET